MHILLKKYSRLPFTLCFVCPFVSVALISIFFSFEPVVAYYSFALCFVVFVSLFAGFWMRDDSIYDGHDKPIFKRYNWKGEEIVEEEYRSLKQ